MGKPWRNWFHCCGHTYGQWVRGDRRGWRSKHHHEHCEGDYKRPPPAGTYDEMFWQSINSMPRDAVKLPDDALLPAINAFVGALRFHAVDVLAFSLGPKHWHGLLRFEPFHPEPGFELPARASRNRTVTHLIGIAKKRTARALSDAGLVPRGGVWGALGGVKPIANRSHYCWVYPYILDHLEEGAVVFDYKRKFIESLPIIASPANEICDIPDV